MEAIIFTGIQASGKSSFYRARFFDTHVRISLDLLRTRNREQQLLDLCLTTQQRFVIDNTNPKAADRLRYIEPSKQARFRVIGYYFQSITADCLRRNARRPEPIPEKGVLGTKARLSMPQISEGFDELWFVTLTDDGFHVEAWRDEI